MNDRLRFLLGVVLALVLVGCVVYEPVVVQPSPQQRFDRSWNAAVGAMADQGMRITSQDRNAGVVRGERAGISIVATLQTLPDGRIQVRFDQSGSTSDDPDLIHRVSDAYERLMGR